MNNSINIIPLKLSIISKIALPRKAKPDFGKGSS